MPSSEPPLQGGTPAHAQPRVAIVIPCHNEELTIAKVVADFRRLAPDANILVVDNASTDGTARLATAAGAEVLWESRPGKGHALLTGLRAVAGAVDFVVMVDGDDTYPAEALPRLMARASAGAEMVIGSRLATQRPGAFPSGHAIGNRVFLLVARLLFGVRSGDLFSGYRVLSAHFLEAAPLLAKGFEIEAELSIQAAVQGFRVDEVPVDYRSRPKDSVSKLRTFRDGYRILLAIFTLFRDHKPLTFFGGGGGLLMLGALLGGGVVIAEFLTTGRILRIPLAILSTGLFLLSALTMTCGVLLSSINRRTAEIAALIVGRGGSSRRRTRRPD